MPAGIGRPPSDGCSTVSTSMITADPFAGYIFPAAIFVAATRRCPPLHGFARSTAVSVAAFVAMPAQCTAGIGWRALPHRLPATGRRRSRNCPLRALRFVSGSGRCPPQTAPCGVQRKIVSRQTGTALCAFDRQINQGGGGHRQRTRFHSARLEVFRRDRGQPPPRPGRCAACRARSTGTRRTAGLIDSLSVSPGLPASRPASQR